MTARIIIFMIFAGFAEGTIAGDISAVNVTTVHDSAMLQLVKQNYSDARRILSNHLLRNPLDLEACYLSFAIEQTRILDYESYLIEQKQFQAMADSMKNILENRISTLNGRDSTICLFYLANVHGGISVMQAKTGNWFEGVKSAITSVSMLKQVKKREPEFYAADLGLGIFNYYLSTSFKWLPFLENKEQEGLASIESALQADFPYNYAAKNSLCWILIERDDFRRADSIAQSVLNEFPDNTIFLRIKALIKLWTGHYEEALTSGRRLLTLTERRRPSNWSDLVAGYTVLVQSYDKLGKKEEACSTAQSMFEQKIPAEYLQIPHIKKNIKYIAGIRHKCRKKRR